MKVLDVLVPLTLAASVIALLILAPTDDLMRTVAYVLLVECPALALAGIGLHAYFDWRLRR